MYKFAIDTFINHKKLTIVSFSIFIAFSVFLFPSFEDTFAGWAWGLFVAVMMVRPLFELVQRFPLLWPRTWEKIEKVDQVVSRFILQVKLISKASQKFGISGIWDLIKNILKIAMGWRREMGILAGVFGLAHGAGILLIHKNKELMDVFDPALWDFRTLWGWGLLAVALMLPLIITSNAWSIKFFKSWWKPWQRIAYGAFIATGIHVFLAEREAGPLVILVLWGLLWLGARFKRVQAPQ